MQTSTLKVFLINSIVVFAVGTGIIVLLLNSRIDSYVYLDPRGTLLTAQAFLKTGSFDLSPYENTLNEYSWQIYRTPEGIYYAYPLGTTILHLPVVWAANQLGYDLSRPSDEKSIHLFSAALSVFFLFLLTYVLSRRFIGHWVSLFFTCALTMGTSFYSSCGMALWNVNYAAITSLLVINILADSRLAYRADSGWILGVLAFIGFTIRPSFALFIVVIYIYLAVIDIKQFFRAAFISACLLALYVMFSVTNFGQLLPGRYQVSDFTEWQNIGKNFLGHLVSPSRGLFVYSPIFLITFVGSVLRWRFVLKNQLAIFLGIWFLTQLILLSSWYMWWGGGSFGYRLLTDILPALVYLSLLVWSNMWQSSERYYRHTVRFILPVLALFSIWVHVIQGANNPATLGWHLHPNKDHHPEFFWDYRFPQFLATEDQLLRMDAWFRQEQLRKHGKIIWKSDVSNGHLTFSGWGPIEGRDQQAFRWSLGKQASIHIPPNLITGETGTIQNCRIRIALWGSTYRNQDIEILLNEKVVGNIKTDLQTASTPRLYYTQPIELSIKATTAELKLLIKTPKAPAAYDSSGSSDHRELGFALREIQVYLVKGST